MVGISRGLELGTGVGGRAHVLSRNARIVAQFGELSMTVHNRSLVFCFACQWGMDENALDPLAGHPRYQKIKHLGEGSYGFVQLAFDKQTQQEVAIKFWRRGAFCIVSRRLVISSFAHALQSFATISRELVS